jgi:hypothetical protein
MLPIYLAGSAIETRPLVPCACGKLIQMASATRVGNKYLCWQCVLRRSAKSKSKN